MLSGRFATLEHLPGPQSRSIVGRSGRDVPALLRHAMFGSRAVSGTPIYVGRNAEIFGDGEPADYVYQVVSGSVRTYKVLKDGRRQVTAFYVAGDVFGLEFGATHGRSAEAVMDSTLLAGKRSTILGIADRNSDVAHRLFMATAAELQRAQKHSLLLIMSARERVAAFLLDMAERLCAEDAVELPMSRQDIADHLGLTIETVSRTLTQLEGDAAINLQASRRIVLRNPNALRRLNG